ncbi:hypothetical protein DB88DRAFT_483541 [Papiliotrema laurentii]|uniref:Yeast cell wall synthesis Kre9/Knh1-like N-terminal domain-containing protein n=1 Tax=Papiliotrema laurentii TaxID=5418 RepID=A0AAD9FSA9_PAPLA|nr:hypothetical protein DB88DRAFT_483541 [Papiliotrema laurentii]
MVARLSFFTTLALAFALGASAIQITTPSNSTGWESKGSQLIEWTSVNTDPSNFTIQLIDPSKPNSPITIAQNVKTSDDSYIYTPSSDLAAGNQWRVNVVSDQGGILAQSDYFAVTEGSSTVTPTSSASSSASSASSAASQSAQSGSSQTSAGASASSAAASASQSTGAATMLIAPTGLLALVAAALGLLA